MSNASSLPSDTDGAIRALYAELLSAWNDRDPGAFAALLTERGNVVGFDGSQLDGPAEVEASLRDIFGNHETAVYIGKVREVRLLGDGVVLLRAVAGMVPRGTSKINPAVNTVQSLVAAGKGDAWRIELFQNTPAAWHGRPAAVEALTAELQRELDARQSRGAGA